MVEGILFEPVSSQLAITLSIEGRNNNRGEKPLRLLSLFLLYITIMEAAIMFQPEGTQQGRRGGKFLHHEKGAKFK